MSLKSMTFEDLLIQQALIATELANAHDSVVTELEQEVRRLRAELNMALVSSRACSPIDDGSCRESTLTPPDIVCARKTDSHYSNGSTMRHSIPELMPGEVDDQDVQIVPSLLNNGYQQRPRSEGNSLVNVVQVNSLTGQPMPPPADKDPLPPSTSPDNLEKASLKLQGDIVASLMTPVASPAGLLTGTLVTPVATPIGGTLSRPVSATARRSLCLPGTDDNSAPPRRRSLQNANRRPSNGALTLDEPPMVAATASSISRRNSRVVNNTKALTAVAQVLNLSDCLEPWNVWYDITQMADIEDPDDTGVSKSTIKRITRMEQMRRMAKSCDFHTKEDLSNPCIRYLQMFVIHPSSPKRLAWVCIGMMLLVYDLIMLPLGSFDLPLEVLGKVMSWGIAIFWTLDVGSHFMVGYHTKGALEMRCRKTIWRYASTWFLVDASLVMIDWAVIFADDFYSDGDGRSRASSARIIKSVRTMRTLRTIRLLRVVKFPYIMREITDAMGRSEHASLLLGIAKHFFAILIVNHVIACLWYALGKDTGWVPQYTTPEDHWDMLYLTALHWSLTQFTPATMTVQPTNLEERGFAVAILLFALITFSSFVSSITNLMTHLRSLKSAEAKQFVQLERYLQDHHISFHLSLRIRRFLEHTINQNRQKPREKDVEMVAKLSDPLRMELHYEVFNPTLNKHPFFNNYSMLNLPAIQKLCHVSINMNSLSCDDVLFNCGETAKCVYFLVSGVAEYTRSDDKTEHISKLLEGKWASEMVLWTPWQHRGLMRATSESSLMALDAASFHKLVLDSKAGQLEASAYALMAVKQLNECFEPSNLSDLESADYDPNAICSKVFKSKRSHAHWLSSVTHGPLDFAARMSTDKMKGNGSPKRNSTASNASNNGTHRFSHESMRSSYNSRASDHSVIPGIPENDVLSEGIRSNASSPGMKACRMSSKSSASSDGSFSDASMSS